MHSVNSYFVTRITDDKNFGHLQYNLQVTINIVTYNNVIENFGAINMYHEDLQD